MTIFKKMSFNDCGWVDVHHYAATGNVDQLQKLDITELTKTNYLQQSAMHIAVLKNQHEVVMYLMQRCPDMIAFEDNNGHNALHYAVNNQRNYMVAQFAAHSPDLIDKTKPNVKSPIEHAVRANYLSGVVSMLIYKPDVPNVFVTCDNNDTLLHLAVEFCDISLVEVLLAIIPRSLVMAQNKRGFTALHNAIDRDIDMVTLLFSANPDAVHSRNWDQNTPVLLVGEFENDAPMLNYFLQVAPDTVEHTFKHGATLLHYASSVGLAKTIFKLKPELIDVVDDDGNTPLHLVMRRDVALFLLERKPSLVYVKNNDGQTPLHYTLSYSNLDVAREILSFKPDLVDTDEHGSTVLHVALHMSHDKLLSLVFCNRMSNLYCKDTSGYTPYQIALQNRNDFAIELFKQHLTIEMMVETNTFTDSLLLTDYLSSHILSELVDIVFSFIGVEQQQHTNKKRKST